MSIKEIAKRSGFIRSVYEGAKQNRLYKHACFIIKAKQKERMEKAAKNALKKYSGYADSSYDLQQLIQDMISMYRRYGFGFSEYLIYRFSEKSLDERLKFVPDWERVGYTDAFNQPRNAMIFDNKMETYRTFQPYYKRQVLYCRGGRGDFEKYNSFQNNVEKIIIKPVSSSKGKGVRILSEKLSQAQFEQMMCETDLGILFEEYIVQCKDISRFNDSSVNTVRMPTFLFGQDVEVVHPFLRLGRNGSVVDNAGSGGIICALDAKTGIVIAAADELGQQYIEHPDSHLQIIDYQVPQWDEAVAFAKELAMRVPSNRYTGWDIALTENGWVLVEANRRGQFVWQIPLNEGFRDELKGYMTRAHVRY